MTAIRKIPDGEWRTRVARKGVRRSGVFKTKLEATKLEARNRAARRERWKPSAAFLFETLTGAR